MESGFPGELACKVIYTISKSHPQTLCLNFFADITDTSPAEASILNMFSHACWDLNGFNDQDPAST
ncbi:hypothetical protein JKF63_01093 [Porcisia hertigi]|uniref:Uncharacterized protein n=1 Tax=Porcisia hertigi TaxID=2761500 RepID=A0A836L308_9TRYP|nr:hypothetical protein JKF63_01093 [Porcisia hertigi]